ncbi:hypothetical protein CC_3055 [Caulobacter vibrioides CB15]|uniref:Uncharacterized protein n=1 Tax=Caulobacter vibrioides (strain ATCC 19089 / CIP 103742 / CB 15) TaxID=190650 RepID=Q9A3Z5_CAUVC|nr:hypothetical protein CC_3055 [Caulobacter vibrioides CB15]
MTASKLYLDLERPCRQALGVEQVEARAVGPGEADLGAGPVQHHRGSVDAAVDPAAGRVAQLKADHAVRSPRHQPSAADLGEADDHGVARALGRDDLGAGGHRLAVEAAGGQGQAAADLLLVGGVDVVRVADVVGDDEAGARIGGDRAALGVAQGGGSGGQARRGGVAAIVGQLHDKRGHVRRLAQAALGHEGAQQVHIGLVAADIGLALIPGQAPIGVRAHRGEHAVIEGRDARQGVPRRAGRIAAGARLDPVAPARQRQLGSVGQGQGPLGRIAVHAAVGVGVVGRGDDGVLAGLQRADRQGVVSLQPGSRGRADAHAVEIGGVHLVDLAKAQGGGLRGLGGGQLDLGLEPDDAVELGQGRNAPAFPDPQIARRGRPGSGAGPGRQGRLAGGLGAPPGLDHLAPATAGGGLVGDRQVQDRDGVVIAADLAKGRRRHPGLDARAAPRGVDQAQRDLPRLLQLAGEVEAAGREGADRVLVGRLPGGRFLEVLGGRAGVGLLDRGHADGVVGRAVVDLVPGVARGGDLHLHVRLARAQPDIADQDVGRAGLGRGGGGGDGVGAAGGRGREVHAPGAVGTGLGGQGLAGEGRGDGLARLGGSEHRQGPVALDDGVVGEQAVQKGLGAGGRGEGGGQQDRRETAHGLLPGCRPAGGSSIASRRVIPAVAQRRAGTQGRPLCAGPWVPDRPCGPSGMTRCFGVKRPSASSSSGPRSWGPPGSRSRRARPRASCPGSTSTGPRA